MNCNYYQFLYNSLHPVMHFKIFTITFNDGNYTNDDEAGLKLGFVAGLRVKVRVRISVKVGVKGESLKVMGGGGGEEEGRA